MRRMLKAAVAAALLVSGCMTNPDKDQGFDESLGLEWTLHEDMEIDGHSPHFYGVTWTGKMFVMVGEFHADSAMILTSPDGLAWTRRAPHLPVWLREVVSAKEGVLAHGFGGLVHSNDGITWTSHPDPINTQAYVWMGDKWYAIGLGYMTSTDGENWDVHHGSATGILDLVWTGKLLVGVGGGGHVSTSPDGVTWTRREVDTDDWFSTVIWTGSQVVAVGYHTVLTSPDGITWTKTDVPDEGGSFSDAVWTGNRLVAVGSNGLVQTSPDGLVWTRGEQKTSSDLLGVAASKSRVVAIGAHGLTLTSP